MSAAPIEHSPQPSGTWRRRLLMAAVALGLAVLLVSVLGAGRGLPAGNGGWLPAGGEAERDKTPHPESAANDDESTRAVCLGYVDVEGGIVSISPTVPGRVAEVCVGENDSTVPAGAVLLKLEDDLARWQLEEAEASLKAAETQLTEARKAPRQHELLVTQQKAAVTAATHELAAARSLAAQKKKLVSGGHSAPEEQEAAAEMVKKLEAAEQAEKAKLSSLELQDPADDVLRAEQNLRAKKAGVEKGRQALGEFKVVAPVAGRVLRVLVSRGDVVGPQSRQPAMLFCPDLPRMIRAEVEQEFAGRVRVGQPVRVHDDTTPRSGEMWKGKVARVADWYMQRRTILPDSSPFYDVRTLECVIELESGQPPLRIGQRVRVTLLGE
jgi:HlyD family secretion protein